MASIFVTIGAWAVVRMADDPPPVMVRLLERHSPMRLVMPVVVLSYPVWGAAGMLFGLLFLASENAAPDGGLGSPNMFLHGRRGRYRGAGHAAGASVSQACKVADGVDRSLVRRRFRLDAAVLCDVGSTSTLRAPSTNPGQGKGERTSPGVSSHRRPSGSMAVAAVSVHPRHCLAQP